jgi:hypothetical protein
MRAIRAPGAPNSWLSLRFPTTSPISSRGVGIAAASLSGTSNDPEFAAQWEEARRDFIDLLEARATQRAIEGDIEPVFYMGVPVAYIRKFDSKLQIEMLRAYKPDRCKTPGTNVNIGTKGDVFVFTEEQRHILMD